MVAVLAAFVYCLQDQRHGSHAHVVPHQIECVVAQMIPAAVFTLYVYVHMSMWKFPHFSATRLSLAMQLGLSILLGTAVVEILLHFLAHNKEFMHHYKEMPKVMWAPMVGIFAGALLGSGLMMISGSKPGDRLIAAPDGKM